MKDALLLVFVHSVLSSLCPPQLILDAKEQAIRSVKLSPFNDEIIVFLRDGYPRIWERSQPIENAHMVVEANHWSIDFPDNETISLGGNGGLLTLVNVLDYSYEMRLSNNNATFGRGDVDAHVPDFENDILYSFITQTGLETYFYYFAVTDISTDPWEDIYFGPLTSGNNAGRLPPLAYSLKYQKIFFGSSPTTTVIDISDPTSPRSYSLPYNPIDIKMSANEEFYFIVGSFGVHILETESDTLLHSFSTISIHNVAPSLEGNELFLASLTFPCTVQHFDISNVTEPLLLDTVVLERELPSHLVDGSRNELIFVTSISPDSQLFLIPFNTLCPTPDSTSSSEDPTSEEREDYFGLFLGLIVGGALVIGVTAGMFSIWFYRKSARKNIQFLLVTKKNEMVIDFDELSLGKELGRGAFGVVYLGEWRNAPCVVKLLHDRSETSESFLEEASIMKNLRPHPNVCRLLGVCLNPNNPLAIVTEYISGGSFIDFMRRESVVLSCEVITAMARDIASGMDHLHSERILHCDLSARNVLVAPIGEKLTVKVADFGMAHKEGDKRKHEKFPVRWSPPEVLKEFKFSKSSDVWSFGIVVWEMAEQKRPFFEIESNEEVAELVIQGKRLPEPQTVPLSTHLWKLLLSCWQEDPSLRPSFQVIIQQLLALETPSKEILLSVKGETKIYTSSKDLQHYYHNNKYITITTNAEKER